MTDRYKILSTAIFVTCSLGVAKAQVPSVDIVFGNVEYVATANGELVIAAGLPAIDIAKDDTSGLITLGIPPMLTDPVMVGVSGPEPLTGISVFPNPAYARITVSAEDVPQDRTILILTADGKPLMNRPWPPGNSTASIDVSNLPTGTHFLCVLDLETNKRYVQRLSVVHRR